MREVYLDIMEKVLSAYTDERIRDFVDTVKDNGITDQGLPRLASNIGVLIAHGRRTELLPIFEEIMDICCDQILNKKLINEWDMGNEFSVREICTCLMALEGKNIVDHKLIQKWKQSMAELNPWKRYGIIAPAPYTPVLNWALFGAVSDFIRGKYCDIDTSEFVEHQLSSQVMSFDENGMYKDPNNPIVYDLVPRLLMAFLLAFGYEGKFKSQIEEYMNKSAEITALMQSVTGEIPFGGRSNQFLNNEPHLACLCEFYASYFARKGDLKKAGEYKASAILAGESLLRWLDKEPISHIKNRYDLDSFIGSESYGNFNKYMVTVASFIYIAFLFADDTIKPTVSVAEKGGYIAQTSKDFHKTFINFGGYFLQIDTNADFHYDANGLGRIHKKDCEPAVCLSVPFSPHPNYVIEGENPSGMSICCYAETDGERLLGAEEYSVYSLIKSKSDENHVEAVFDVKLSCEITIKHKFTITENGVDISLSGYENIGFMLPVFDFDGKDNTDIKVYEKKISVEYQGAVCEYSFDGDISSEYEYYYNRNGRYRVYAISSKKLHIEMKKVIL